MDMPRQERGFEPRSERNDPVVITRSDQTTEGGLIVEIAGRSLTVKLPTAIQAGTPVQVETKNMLVLCDVTRCDATDDGFRLGLILRDSLDRKSVV